MCARYKADSDKAPGNRSQGSGVAYTQSAPRRRVPAGQYDRDDEAPQPTRQQPAPIQQQRDRGSLHVNINPNGQGRGASGPLPLRDDYVDTADPLNTPPDMDGRRVLHDDGRRDPSSAFGTPGPKREYRKSRVAPAADDTPNPWAELKSPPKKGTSLWQGLLIWLFFPKCLTALMKMRNSLNMLKN